MDAKDIKMEPGQVAVLIWIEEEDCYNVAGVFQTVQLAYDHAMSFIFTEDKMDSVFDVGFKGFCIETRNVVKEREAETIGTDDEDYYAHEEYYFNEKGHLRCALGNACAGFGSTFYMDEEMQEYIEEEASDVHIRDMLRRYNDPKALDEAAEAVYARYEEAFKNLAE